MSIDERVSFGPFTLDPDTLELWCGDSRAPLEPQPARLLLRLARDAGSLVSRRDLVDIGWPGSLPSVAEQSLNTCIYQIRRALDSGGAHGVELETLRGRGYRLSVPAPAPSRESAPHSTVAGPSRRRLPWIPMGFASAAAIAVALTASLHSPSSVPDGAERTLERARYLAAETGDVRAARAVLDSGRAAFPEVAAMHAEWAELGVLLADFAGAMAGADRALALDARSATAWRARGALHMARSEWPAAEEALERALALAPDDTRTHAALAYLRTIHQRFDEADTLLREALRIDPLSTTLYRDAGLLYLLMGRYDEADRFCRGVLRFQPRSIWATDCLFDATVLAGRTEEAASWGRRLLELYDAAPPSARVAPERAVAETEAWRLERWAAAVDDGAYPFGLALAYAAAGETEKAIEALRAAARQPRLGLLGIAVDPRLASLRGHPGFRDLEARLRLPG